MLSLCHYSPALLRFWFQTNLGRTNSASFFFYLNTYFFLFIYLFIKQKYVTILTLVHLDKCSCIGH